MGAYLTYALLNNELVKITDERVKNGFSCECICPECDEKLNARNNATKVEKHFAHRIKKDYNCGYESAIHLLAKIILSREKKLYLPDFHYDYMNKNINSKFKDGELVIFESIELEAFVSNNNESIRVDSIGVVNDNTYYIEFAKTHFIDAEKKQKLTNFGYPCIEISLNNLKLDELVISNFLANPNPQIYWILNPHYDNLYIKYKEDKEKRIKAVNKSQKNLSESIQELENKEKLTNKEKVDAYLTNEKYPKYKLHSDKTLLCPLFQKKFKIKFCSEDFNSRLVQWLIKNNWSGVIYSGYNNEKYIYVEGDKILLQPSDLTLKQYTKQKIDNYNKRYKLVKEFIEVLDENIKLACKTCAYCTDIYELNYEKYSVCNAQ